MLKTEIIDPLNRCNQCGQPVTEALPDGWYGWCPVCREAWVRWWNSPKTRRKSPSRKLKFRV